MNPRTYRFRTGRFECIAVYDGLQRHQAVRYVAAVPSRQVVALREHGPFPQHLRLPCSGLVVSTGAHTVLIDTGGGVRIPGAGLLEPHLRAVGIEPEAIDTVIITHAHLHHVGGTTDAAGRPVFANARHLLGKDEWTYWTSPATPRRLLDARRTSFVREHLEALRDQLELLDHESEVVPGIRAIPAPGHTPGQMALLLSSADDALLCTADAALHPVHLAHPDPALDCDLDPQQAAMTRRRLFGWAADEHALVLASHFAPFPSLGHVVRQRAGWQWQPLSLAAMGIGGSPDARCCRQAHDDRRRTTECGGAFAGVDAPIRGPPRLADTEGR